eukprot:RCo010452
MALRRSLVRSFSTASSQVAGLNVAQLREQLASPVLNGKPTIKMPPYLKPSQLRPTRGCFTDEFVLKNYVWSAVKDGSDPKGDKARLYVYMVKAQNWGTLLAMSRATVLFILSHFRPTKSSQALANIEVDIGDIPEGKTVTIIWRGKPVFVRHRTKEEIKAEASVNLAELRDPQTDAERIPYPEWAVFVGVCTHLGCVPVAGEGKYGAYLCPCHCAVFDHSGRIRSGPAPLNLEVPPHKLLDENTLYLGDLRALGK